MNRRATICPAQGRLLPVLLPAQPFKGVSMLTVVRSENRGTRRNRQVMMGAAHGKRTPSLTSPSTQHTDAPRSPEIRLEKVLYIRAQLAKGKYDFRKRLDIAFENLLGDLAGQSHARKY